jgi:nicotinic acid mononucleotide adenylyltransferase
MRIALFGGTFDPPHRGHIAIATAAADAFALDQVLFAPTGLQPLKLSTEPTPFATRLALVEAACEEDPRFTASNIDAPRSDRAPNYTVDTLANLRAEHPHPEDTLFNLVGADAFLGLPNWRSPRRACPYPGRTRARPPAHRHRRGHLRHKPPQPAPQRRPMRRTSACWSEQLDPSQRALPAGNHTD